MPPRGSRGKLARGRGGRGKAPTKLAEEPSCSAQEPAGTNTNDEPTSQSTLEASSATESARVTTPQRLQDADPSPNSSPATVPTETPAPTPARPTQQPDESAAGSSAVASPTRGGGGVTRGKRGRGGTAAPSKFKPKIIRREQSEREELAREEQKRKETAAAQVAREEARLSRGRGRGFPGRGRGDAMGRGRDDRKTTATGTFGVAPAELGKQKGLQGISGGRSYGASRSGGGGGPGGPSASGGSAIKKESTGSGGLGRGSGHGDSKNFFPEPEYPDEEDGPRIDIETINIPSDDDEPVITGVNRVNKGKGVQKGGLKPVRLHREEHKERATVVNTDPSTKLLAPKETEDSDTDMPSVDEQRSSRPGAHGDEEFKGVYQDLVEPVKIKEEPGVSFAYRDHAAPVAPGSPEDFKKRPQELTSSAPTIDLDASEPTNDNLVKAKKDKKARRNSKKKERKPVIQTEEDRAEYARHLEDVAILAKELGGMQTNMAADGQDQDGDVAMDGTHNPEQGHGREGRLYLFQFPPVLPKLWNPLTGEKPVPKGVITKTDDKPSKGADKNTEMSGTSKGKQVDLTTSSNTKEIKIEEDIPNPKEKEKNERKKRDEVVSEEGYIGKLIVRESGKVELCWGGTSLVVGRGVDAGFLTTGVVVDANQRGGQPGAQQVEGKALGMGKVMGKFVVTPDWEKM